MKIQYLGHSSFLLESAGGTRVVTDPYGEIGFPFPRVKADGVTVSHAHYDHCNVAALGKRVKVFDRAGTFSLGEFSISSMERYHDDCGGRKRGKDLVFFLESEGVRVCHLGDLGEPFSPELAASFGKVDVLMIPVGGNYTIGGEEAAKYVRAISPRVAIPMHFYTPGLTVDISGPEAFLSHFSSVRRARELVVTRETPAVEGKIIVLERL